MARLSLLAQQQSSSTCQKASASSSLEAVAGEQALQETAGSPKPNRLKRMLMVVGPGLITGAANDPAGIGTYALAGATFGFSTLWLVLLLFPLMTAVQFTCAKIGLVTGRGLAVNVRRHYPSIQGGCCTSL